MCLIEGGHRNASCPWRQNGHGCSFCERVHDGSERDKYFLFSLSVTRVVFWAQPCKFVRKKLVGNQLWGPPKWDLNYPNTMVFGDSIVSPTWDLVRPTENTILVVF